MSLPTWTEKEQFTDRDWAQQMDRYHKALTIAWEALESVKDMVQPYGVEPECNGCCGGEDDDGEFIHEKDCDFMFIDKVMRRIEEMGKP